MKKFIMILSALLIGMSAIAQEWDSFTLPKDEMRGRMTEQEVLRYCDAEILFCLYTESEKIGLALFNGICDYYGTAEDKRVDIEVGFYDKENNYHGKKEYTFVVGSNSEVAILTKQTSEYLSIYSWLKRLGSIRLLIPRFRDIDLDVTIPQIQ